MSSINIQKIEFFKAHDFTGKSGYSDDEKKKILNDFLDLVIENTYFSSKTTAFKVSSEDDTMIHWKSENDKEIEILKDNLRLALVYLGYTDGNFKWTKYLLMSSGKVTLVDKNDDKKKTEHSGMFYLKLENSIGIGKVMSALANQIAEFGKNEDVESNIMKMMKRNKYKLKNSKNKNLLFGKGHMADQSHKVQIKRDLDIIFKCMRKSKDAVNLNQDTSPQNFDEELKSLQFFIFEKF